MQHLSAESVGELTGFLPCCGVHRGSSLKCGSEGHIDGLGRDLMFDPRNPRDERRDLTPAVAFPGARPGHLFGGPPPPHLTQNWLFYRFSGPASVTLQCPTLGLQVEQAAPWPPFVTGVQFAVTPPAHLRPSAARWQTRPCRLAWAEHLRVPQLPACLLLLS